jgi:outer membrane protein OmpA-like peptidoglycan-associated protein
VNDQIELKLHKAEDKVGSLLSGKKNSITVKSYYEVTVIEMEDINFHFDSAVLLPDYGPDAPQPGTEEQNRITGLGVLFACFKQAEKKDYLQKILVAGHTDKKGGEYYNLTLSQKRSENVFYMFTGQRVKWVNSSEDKNKVEDKQQILKWISYNFGWDCDPGEITNSMNPETEAATLKFQKRYNIDFVTLNIHGSKFSRTFTHIDEDGKVGKQTWGAFFDMYTLELLIVMGINEDGLNEKRTKLQFVEKGHSSPAPTVGCGENFPASGSQTEDENAEDRRVEILFFDEGEEPELKCHPSKFVCNSIKCDLYGKKIYKQVPVPAEPLPLPSGKAVRVHFKFVYKTPEGNERNFPKDFSYILKYGDGSSETRILKESDGSDFIQVLREKKSFTIEFKPEGKNIIASPQSTSNPDELVGPNEVNEKAKNNYKVFSLPNQWNLKNSSWELTPAVSNYDDNDKTFKNLDDLSVENIGSEASPVKMILDPHWQYIKFLYFDRWIKKKLSIPPVLIEGFSNSTTASGDAEIISNWITPTEASQCIPWILQETAKPDNNVLLRIRTKENTFIESSGDASNFTRKLVTQGTASSTSDVGLNIGDPVNINFNFANAFRLRYYDLPKLWKSSKYFTQLSGGTGAPAQKVDKFEQLASSKTEDQKPLIISLDDIILTDKDIKPLNWKPEDKLENRIIIFSNTFSRTGDQKDKLTSEGLYKPDGNAFTGGKTPKNFTANKLGFLTQLPQDEKDRNYISDYPDWTRLIITQGNAFDVFDKRTEESKSEVVGARAAVRIFDVFSSSNTFVPPDTSRPRVPPAIKSSFCDVQPFFEQDHEMYDHIGRFDVIRLRCCDVDSDQKTELGACIVYLRLSFNFNKPSDKPDNSEPFNIPENDQKEWIETAIMNLLRRWNGPDQKGGISPQTFNPGAARILSSDTSKLKFKSKIIWYAQQFPTDKSHFELGIYKHTSPPKKIRAFMRTSNGTGVLDKVDNVPSSNGFFTFAHECGHGGSLVDEYVEQTTPTTFPLASWLDGFDCNSPGSPFSLDVQAIMRQNREVRARHSWHLAELFSKLDSKNFDYKIKYASNDFFLPHLADAPLKNYVGWPDKRQIDVELGDHGKFNLFLYPLGKDEYTTKVIPALTKKPADYDGIFIVLIKMEFDFPTDNKNTIHNFLNNINSRIDKKFNFKFGIKNKAGSLYQNCLLHFSARYYADDYSATDPDDDDEHIKIEIKEGGKAEWDSGLFSSKHKLFFPINVPHIFTNFFANMVGLAEGTEDNTSSYLPIVKKLLSNVEIFKFTP